MVRVTSLLLVVSALGCAHPSSPATSVNLGEGKRVLVVMNAASSESVNVGRYYAQKRGVPNENLVLLSTSVAEEIPLATFRLEIEKKVFDALKTNRNPIDFIVTTRDVPLRIREGGYSVDAFLAASQLPNKPVTDIKHEEQIRGSLNPYFQSNAPFHHDPKGGLYLVTRLDGYTLNDALRLVDNSLAAKPEKGLFFFDGANNRREGGYGEMQSTLSKADAILKQKNFESRYDDTATFVAPKELLAGYASWGSNDGNFDPAAYRRIQFRPGALAETFVSTSGRTFRPTSGGQSLIADLIANGVTGVKGYVSEPYTFALAKPDIMFDRYTSGRNLAESLYAASLMIKWKDVMIGDPLCSPYATAPQR